MSRASLRDCDSDARTTFISPPFLKKSAYEPRNTRRISELRSAMDVLGAGIYTKYVQEPACLPLTDSLVQRYCLAVPEIDSGFCLPVTGNRYGSPARSRRFLPAPNACVVDVVGRG